MTWLQRKCHASLKYKRKTGTLSSSCEELYLRDDLSCGSQRCDLCQPSTLIMAADASHILLPDEQSLTLYLDLFELPEMRNYVLCTSELRKISQSGSARFKGRVRTLYRDSRKGVHHFDNLHHVYIAQMTASSAISPLLPTASFYWQHLHGHVHVVVLSDALAQQTSDEFEANGVHVMGMQQYVQQYWSHSNTVMDLFDSIQQAMLSKQQEPGAVGSRRPRYPPYLSQQLIDAGLASGELLQGTLSMQRSMLQRHEGIVQVGSNADSSGQLVRVTGRHALNRAMHGDVVVLQLLPDALQTAESSTDDPTGMNVAAEESEEMDGLAETGGSSAFEAQEDAEPELLEEGGMEEKLPSIAPSQLLLAGEVVGIMQRSNAELVACLSVRDEEDGVDAGSRRMLGSMARVVPMDPRYPIAIVRTRHLDKLRGQRFVIRMGGWRAEDGYPDAIITRLLGPLNAVQAETEAILVQCGVNWQPFCEGAMAELPAVADASQWKVPAQERELRRDLTCPEYFICSIDPPGCTDVDDALHVRQLPGSKWEVGVHIADVSYFVQPGSLLDREAAARCTTVYMVGRRLDMLPSLLSEQLASLRAGSPRLSVSVIWTLSSQLHVLNTWFGRTLIVNRHQLEYRQAQHIMDGQQLPPEWWIPEEEQQLLRKNLVLMRELAGKLRNGRMAQGALELESAEFQFEMGADMQPQELLRKQKVPMMDIVAEMMIFANAAVAQHIAETFPAAALLRNHAPPPRDEAFQEVSRLCAELGVPLDPSSNKSLARSIQAAACSPACSPSLLSLLKSLITRAMSQARYFSTGNAVPRDGGFYHYGLALPYYTHFTSPIRRYADVVVHRQLLAALSSPAPQPPLPHARLELAAKAMNSRHQEAKRAQQASRQLYLLTLLRTHPQVERALVCGLHARGVEVFFPHLHTKAKVFLQSKEGVVRPPAATEDQLQEKELMGQPVQQHLRLQSVDGAVMITDDSSGKVVCSIRLWQSVWVLMRAEASRSRGLLLRLQLLAPHHPRVELSAEPLSSAEVVRMVAQGESYQDLPSTTSNQFHCSLPSSSPSTTTEDNISSQYNISPGTSPITRGGMPSHKGLTASPIKKISVGSPMGVRWVGAAATVRAPKGRGAPSNCATGEPGFLYDVLQASAEAAQQPHLDAVPASGLKSFKLQVAAPLALVQDSGSSTAATEAAAQPSGSSLAGLDKAHVVSVATAGGLLLSQLQSRLAHYHARWNACGRSTARRSKLAARVRELTERIAHAQAVLGTAESE